MPVTVLGLLLQEEFVVRYNDGEEETVRAGEAYLMGSGHRPVYIEETDALTPGVRTRYMPTVLR